MRLFIKVKPWAKVESVEPILQGYKVSVREPAQDGKANKRAIELLAKHLGVAKSSIEIKSGATGRTKIVLVHDKSK